MSGRFLIREAADIALGTCRLVVDAPRVAQQARPGQFVIVRATEYGERIPLTICNADPSSGTIGLVVQAAGRTTSEMQALEIGDRLHQFGLGRGHRGRTGTDLLPGQLERGLCRLHREFVVRGVDF